MYKMPFTNFSANHTSFSTPHAGMYSPKMSPELTKRPALVKFFIVIEPRDDALPSEPCTPLDTPVTVALSFRINPP